MTPEPEKERPFYAKVSEAAEYLDVSNQYVYQLIREGRIPHRKYGNGRGFRIPWLWLIERGGKEKEERPVQIALAEGNLYVLTNRGNIYRRYHGETLLRWFAVHGPWEGPVGWGEDDVADALAIQRAVEGNDGH